MSIQAGEVGHDASRLGDKHRKGSVTGMDGKMSLVVIDDHAEVRTALKERIELRTRFVVVGEASDGLSGLELVRRLEPHVALVDWRLPLLRGDEVIRIIRRRWPSVSIVAMSSSSEPDAMHAMLAAGAAGYLTKGDPVDDLESLAFRISP